MQCFETITLKAKLLSFSLFIAGSSILFPVVSLAQTCPPNIDFESGNFNGWQCYLGNTTAASGTNYINLGPSSPIAGNHTLFDRFSGGTDPYGGFPVNCPNGSGYTIKLGNDQGGGQAEGVSYRFVIPAGQNVYSLIYHYAVVFQDPNHEHYQQPRMQVEIKNVTDDVLIDCSSFSFIPYGTPLPGFYQSPVAGEDGTPVWCKNWSAVSVNLNGLAGKTIELYFKTADCTFRRHFGYAYIDVNSECSDEFTGARFCTDDTSVTVTAPYGYQNYTWFNNTFTQQLGNQQNLVFTPPPSTGSTVAVVLEPYNGYGCVDTLYANLLNNLTLTATAGADITSCNAKGVGIGAIPKPGLVYSWFPTTDLSDPSTANPVATPRVTTSYELTVRNSGGGCATKDSVLVKASFIDSTMQLLGKDAFCFDSRDSAVLNVSAVSNIQWFADNRPVPGAITPRYRVATSGTYHAVLTNSDGCKAITHKQPVLIEMPKPGIRYPLEYVVANSTYGLDARRIGTKVLWSPATSLSASTSFTPDFRGSADQLYTIRIETAAGCITIDTQKVEIAAKADIYVPTAFTPNRDGRNDLLGPVLMGIKEFRYFRVYNRWGELLYETRTIRTGWDGTYKGIEQATGAVVWIAEAVGVDGQVYQRKGTTVLIR